MQWRGPQSIKSEDTVAAILARNEGVVGTGRENKTKHPFTPPNDRDEDRSLQMFDPYYYAHCTRVLFIIN